MSICNGDHVLSIRERGEISFAQIIAIPHMETTVLKPTKYILGLCR
jgi:hypothetical protein